MKHQSLLKWCMALLMVVVSYSTLSAREKVTTTEVGGIEYYLYDDYTAEVHGYTYAVPAKIIIPEYIEYSNKNFSVTSIGDYAFDGCNSLQSIEMNSVTSIGLAAFYGCTSLQSIKMNSVTSIGDYAFSGCNSLQSIEMNSVTSIGPAAFYGCTSLQSVEMNSVTSIEGGAFYGCTSLQSVEMNSVTSIGDYAFSGCNSLQSVEMNSITSFRNTLFRGNTSLQSIKMNSVTSIGDHAFDGCNSLQSVEMNSVTSIGDDAFSGCNSLQSVEMNSVTSIGSCAFYGCNSLQSVEMNSVTSIEGGAFSGCNSLESVEMNSVTSIGNHAFYGCSNLRSIRLLNPVPPTLGSDAFYELWGISVAVPFKSKNKYLEEWGSYPGYSYGFTYHCFGSEDEAMEVETDNTAGQLMNNININNLPNIWSLTISGEINGSDLNVINRMENLERLDLSNCRVAAGGAAYYKSSNKDYFTQDDILGEYSIRVSTLDSIAYPQVTEIKESAVSIPYILSHAVVPASVTTLYPTSTCLSYLFSYGDNNLLTTSTGTSSIKGARKVELGRPVSNTSFFQKVSSTLEEVVITYPYTELYDSFFSGCSKLSSIKLPSSLQKIGSETFYNCSSLPSIKIPASVQQIGSQAFAGCTNLTEVICCAQTPPSASADSFSIYKDATLYVPVGTRNAYFFDPVWGMFGNIVESEELTNGVSDVMAEDNDGPVSVYDLQGIQRYHGERDAMPTLPRGVYIIRTTNGKAEKVML